MRELLCPALLAEALEVESITSEYALQLIALRLDMPNFSRVMQTGTNLSSGKLQKSRTRQSAGQLRKEPQSNYLGELAAYETSFGREAMDPIKHCVDQEVKQKSRSFDRVDLPTGLF